jgi:hypothetical protein
VAHLMRGPQNGDDQPDPGLGKSLREGFRNLDAAGRAFGLPSVRTDLPEPRRRSVANVQNYGNEPDVLSLLAPCSTAERYVPPRPALSPRLRLLWAAVWRSRRLVPGGCKAPRPWAGLQKGRPCACPLLFGSLSPADTLPACPCCQLVA